ncbi:MAG: hypothetical protein LBR20_04720 [Propionibacteriaceae bacterium]|jgi:hypothetical protein|nr:hypothetical protein [Propionibacteriaceae bacterium]
MKKLAAVGLALATLWLSGCAGGSQVAARVGDQVVTEAEVDQLFQLINDPKYAAEDGTTMSRLNVLVSQVEILAAQQFMAENDAEPLPEAKEYYLAQYAVLSNWLSVGGALGEWADGYVDLFVLMNGAAVIGGDKNFDSVLEGDYTYVLDPSPLFEETDEIEVNPRYGSWDPSSFAISGSGSLSYSESEMQAAVTEAAQQQIAAENDAEVLQ